MKKIFLFFITVIYTHLLFTQNIGTDPEMPSLVGKSPDAYNLGKYGEIPVNESSGSINYSIPLYTYGSGDISVPISLYYSGNGVKCNQSANKTGLNWILSAGGVITRTVRDYPDPWARATFSSTDLNNLDDAWDTHDGQWKDTINFIYNSGYDNEADIFSYNFLGHSGSFFLDDNFNVRIIKQDQELLIEPFLSYGEYDSEIKITDPNGVKYYFGGANATEISRTIKGVDAIERHTEWAQTAFYLYKIVSPNGAVINIDYQQANEMSLPGRSQTRSIITGQGCNGMSTTYSASNDETKTVFMYGNYYINKITSNIDSSRVKFIVTGDSLTNIEIYKNEQASSLYKSYELVYETPEVSPGVNNLRFFLTKVKEKNASDEETGVNIEFSYDNMDMLPQQNSFAQDHFGYYNGANDNTTLVPKGYLPVLDDYYDLADRDADFSYAKIGSLTQIRYPTGGITKFDYEPRYEGTKNLFATFNMYAFTRINHDNQIEDVYPDTSYFVPYKDQDLDIEIETTASTEIIGQYFTARLKIFNITDTTSFTSDPFAIGTNSQPGPYSKTFNFTYPVIKDKAYSFELLIDTMGYTIPDSTTLDASAKITYIYNVVPKQAPGFRIKRITSQPSDDPNYKEIKRFYYNTFEKRNTPNHYAVNNPRYLKTGLQQICCLIGDPTKQIYLPEMQFVTTLSSSSLTNIYSDDSQKILYPTVTISYGGDNFELGGIEKHFMVKEDNDIFLYKGEHLVTTGGTNLSWENGTLLKGITYKKENDSIIKSKVTEYTYKTDPLKTYEQVNNVASLDYEKQFCDLSDQGVNDGVGNVAVGIYYTYSNWYALDMVTVKEYFGNDSTVAYTKYYYDTGLAGLPTRIEQTDSKGNIYMVKNYYPSDSTIYNEFSEPERNILKRMSSDKFHIISPTILSENYKNNNKLFTQRSIYSHIGTNIIGDSIFQKTKIQASTTESDPDALEDRAFFNYNEDLGNILEMYRPNGKHISYVWGYNQSRVVAKIENIQYDSIDSFILQKLEGWNYDTDSSTIKNDNDTIRNYPGMEDCFITTISYDPIVGIKTQTDPNGRTSYFFYDENNRLLYVKDHKGNIIKKYEYNIREDN